MNSYSIIADSGSTKTDWVVIDDQASIVDRIKTIGFNPYFQSSSFIFNHTERAFSQSAIPVTQVSAVHFYGAGCSSQEKQKIVATALQRQFPKATINVRHDLEAAARASIGNESGIACIIGTGSNSCVWEDGKVTANIASHGYVFGDEGSGSYLGIELVKLYLDDKLPHELKLAFEEKFQLSKDEILNTTYREENPNVFLAHFAIFYTHYKEHQVLRDIIYKGFEAFFRVRVLPYPNYRAYELGFVGSIAFHYQEILAEVAAQFEMRIQKISKCPIDDLVEYHREGLLAVNTH